MNHVMGKNRKGAAIAAPTVFTRRFLPAATGLALALLLSVGLGACREEEQGRRLLYEKGTYGGQSDTDIPDETLNNLRQRANQQRGP
jgi:hypothetical protein